jgi:hypothetical protein
MHIQAFSAKNGTLYCACSPEWDVVSYGSCEDEALNNLQDEVASIKQAAQELSDAR